jgi:hypothetical protein
MTALPHTHGIASATAPASPDPLIEALNKDAGNLKLRNHLILVNSKRRGADK